MSENFRPNVCGKYALQGSSRALYTHFDPTHEQCIWPVRFHEVGCAVLIWIAEVKDGSLVVWSDGLILVVWSDDGVVWELVHGLICSRIWDKSDSLVSWSDMGRILWVAVVVWLDGLIWRTDWGRWSALTTEN